MRQTDTTRGRKRATALPRRITCAIAAAAALALASPTQAGPAPQKLRLTVVAGAPAASAAVRQLVDTLAAETDRRLAATKGAPRLEWVHRPDGQIARAAGVLEAVEDGLADIGLVPLLDEAERLPLQLVAWAAPFGPVDCRTQAQIQDQLHAGQPAMRDAWSAAGQTYLASAVVDSLNLLTTRRLATPADLAGLRLVARAPVARWFDGVGVKIFPLTGRQARASIADGLVDGIVAETTYIRSFDLQDKAGNLTRLDFGAMPVAALTIATGRLADLPPVVAEALRAAADDYATAVADLHCRRAGEDREAMRLDLREPTRAERTAWAAALAPVAQDWAKGLAARGLPAGEVLAAYMTALRDRNLLIPRAWDAP
ncbi:MAG: hypothetical protein AB7N54_18920 [Alphaproteobacteria bacterium]